MTPAPPPPPANIPSFSVNSSNSKLPGLPNTSALLKSIEKGTKLKKTVTNDRSAPLVSNQTNSCVQNKTPPSGSSKSTPSNSANLGGLFANGFPTLRSTKHTSESIDRPRPKPMAGAAPEILKKPANKLAQNAMESLSRDPEKGFNVVKKGAKIAAPAIISEASNQLGKNKSCAEMTNSVRATGNKILPPISNKVKNERWHFPIEKDENLPSPRKFTGCKKHYISAKSKESDKISELVNDDKLTESDIKGFIKTLKSKIEKAAQKEDFEECVRLKSKLKSFEAIEKRIHSGEQISAQELPAFMDKRLSIQVNCNRKISGVLRGFDAFMNIVLDETIEECKSGNLPMGTVVLRGNSILMIEALEKIN